MAKRRQVVPGKVTRLEARTRALRAVNRVVFAVFALSAGFVVVAAALPQKRHVELAEQKVSEAKQREAAAVAEKEDRAAEYRALKEDPAYLELQARDRLDFFREGERVLRIKRPE